MSIVIGIDVGISAAKILGIENGTRIKSPMRVPAHDAIASAYGALGKYIQFTGISVDDIEQIMVTGVGAHELSSSFYDIPTTFVDEFIANGLGARFDSGLDHFIVVSMGTGTSLVRVDGDDIRHIGGIGMGGGTIQGLSRIMLETTDMDQVKELADFGYASHINLRIKDICSEEIDGLNDDATASLFGKVNKTRPNDNDIAAGIVHMVLETIGSAAVLSQLNGGFKDFVLIGMLTEFITCKYVFSDLERLYGVHFHIPKFAPFCTALGAALSYGYEDL